MYDTHLGSSPVARGRLFATIAVVACAGVLTKFYTGPGAHWVATKLGGLLYVVFWILVVLALFPGLSRLRVAVGVLVATCALEISQLWHPSFLTGIRSTFIGHALIGSTFSALDFPMYVAGALAGYALAGALTARGRAAERAAADPGGA